MLKYLAVTAAIVLGTTSANAGLLLEPYMGLSQGQTYSVAQNAADTSYKTSGTVLGGRIGYTLPILFWLGLDYSLLAGGKAKPDFGGSEGELTRSDLYAVVGVDLPILLRAWAGFGLMNTSTDKRNGVETKVTGGTKMKAGVGLTMLPFVSINLELFNHKGPKVENAGAALSMNTFEDTGGILGVSIPFDL